jgi:cob(I)alamin adenosyltransferase
MGHRLTKIYTRTGDDGSTGLADGTRVRKDAARMEAIGAVDELNSHIGVVLCETLSDRVRDSLVGIQHDLFDLGGELSVPGHAMLDDGSAVRLERLIDAFNADLPPLKDFILPGGTRAAALTHVARAACRRAERRLVALQTDEATPAYLVRYLNRLSDLLFVLARALNRDAGVGDVLWQQGKNR